MYPLKYYDIYQDSAIPFNTRLKMVQMAQEKGIAKTAREWQTTRKTVRKWFKRYQAEGTKGLKDRSRAPKHIPHKTSHQVEERVLRLRQELPTFGQDRLKHDFGLPCSSWAINRILNQHHLIKRRRSKRETKRKLWAVKKRLLTFERIQIDTKELKDIPEYLPYIYQHHFPTFQYTARDVKSGAQFLAYAYANNSTNAAIFAAVVGNQLRKYGIKLAQVTFQTDNGVEYTNAYHLRKHLPFFTLMSTLFLGVGEHYRIPPGAKTWQSDVETAHGLIENEFYCLEKFAGLTEFLGKAYAYQLFFNFKRSNTNKDHQSPLALLQKDRPEVNPNVLNLPPVILESYLKGFTLPKHPWEEAELKENYAKMGVSTKHGYLLPYVLRNCFPVQSWYFSSTIWRSFSIRRWRFSNSARIVFLFFFK